MTLKETRCQCVTRVISAYVEIMKNYDRSSVEENGSEPGLQKSLRNGGK